MKGPKALHFPKFSENFQQFSNPKILFSFLKCRYFNFFFWILIKRINSNLQEMEKNYIWIFTLEFFQNVPRSGNSESSHRCCIPLKVFWDSQIFQVKHFFGRDTFFDEDTIFGEDSFFGVELFLEETLFG